MMLLSLHEMWVITRKRSFLTDECAPLHILRCSCPSGLFLGNPARQERTA